MKVIGLINRIYEGTQPKHIRYNNEDWYWNDYDGYVTKESLKTTPDAQIYLHDRYRLLFALEEEVEIIKEDKPSEEIRKLQSEIDMLTNKVEQYYSEVISFRDKTKYLKDKLNELIKENKE